jgi:tyrosyl-tRNA synthetase
MRAQGTCGEVCPDRGYDRLPVSTDALDRLTRHAVDVLPDGLLAEKLRRGAPLRVKLGIDPTAPDIHLGFAFVLDRLAGFQREGHTVVLIVGDYTARIGDPSGRSKERPVLPDEALDANARQFAEQAFRILERERTEIRYNGEWLGALSYAEVVRLTRTLTVAARRERDDFATRFAAHEPISLSELLYPLMQAYDSVAIEADVEIGGTDQLYNLLAGRTLMPHYGLESQVVMTYPLLVGLDGHEKMSKSRGNYVGVTEPPEEMFGKVMSIPDAAVPQWWELVVDGGEHASEPMEWKLELARRITTRWHGSAGADRGEAHFTRVVREGGAPDEVPELALPPGDPVHLPALLAAAFGLSTSDARRMIAQGGVKVDGEPVTELDLERGHVAGALLQAGKRRFVRLENA